MKPIHVVIAAGVYPPDIGGPATYAKLIAGGLPSHGVKTSVVAFRDVRAWPVGIRHLLYLYKVYRTSRRADVILTLDPYSAGVPAMFAAFLLKKPLILRVGGDYAWEQGRRRFGVTRELDTFVRTPVRHPMVWLFRCLQTLVARRAGRIIVPSEYLKGIVEQWGIPAGAITVIPSVVSAPVVRPNKETLRSVLQFSGTMIMSAGRLVPWKGFDVLIDAFATIRTELPDAVLVIAGDGPERAALEHQAAERGCAGAVRFTGSLPKETLHQYIKAADVFVLASSYEGLSHQLLEVMHIGTPLIATAVGGNPELIKDGKEGMLVPYGDAEALAKALTRVLRDSAQAHERARAATARAQRLNPDHMLARLADILKTCVSS